jgi:hypothetical protein
MKSSCFSPETDGVVIDACQFDRFEVVASKPFRIARMGVFKVKDQGTNPSPYHAPQSEKRHNPRNALMAPLETAQAAFGSRAASGVKLSNCLGSSSRHVVYTESWHVL